jgi:hypothetical protein
MRLLYLLKKLLQNYTGDNNMNKQQQKQQTAKKVQINKLLWGIGDV